MATKGLATLVLLGQGLGFLEDKVAAAERENAAEKKAMQEVGRVQV